MRFTRTPKSRTKSQKTRKSVRNNQNTTEKNLRIITTEGHIFNVIDEFETRIRIQSNNKSLSCIQVLIYKEDNSAILEEVAYHNSCSKKEGGLPTKDGTKHMCQTILKYLIDTYPFIERVDVRDKSAYNINKNTLSFITARYLLEGRKGLYQEYLNAKPTPETLNLINIIEEKRNILDKIIPKIKTNDWWTSENIIKLINYIYRETDTNYIKKRNIIRDSIINNLWFIDKEIIRQYDITYSKMRVSNFLGGFKYNDNFSVYINNIIPSMYRQIFPKE
jgi:hypothetical protein